MFSVVVNVGRAIYEALSYLNPFARHSPSLVEQVDAGVDAIVAKYRDLGLIAQPINAARLSIEGLSEAARKTAVDAMKASVDSLRDRAQILGDALSVAKGRLADFLNTPLQGQRAFTDRLDGITDKLAQNRLKLLRMDMRLDPRVGRGALRREGRQLEKEAELTRLEELVALGPQRRAITQAADTRQELPFDAIIAGIKATIADIRILEPAVNAANAAWKAHADILQDVQRAISAAKGAGASLGDQIAGGIGDLSFLDELREKQAQFQRDFARMREDVITQAAPFVQAVDSMSASLKRFGDGLKTFGVAGGLSELLFPSAQRIDDIDATLSQERGIHGDAAFLRARPRFVNLPDIAAEITEWMKAQFAAVNWPAVWKAVKGHGAAMVGNLAPIVDDVAAWYVSNFIPGLLKGAEEADYTKIGKALLEQTRLQMPVVRELDLLTSVFTGQWRDQLSSKLTSWAGSDWVLLVGRLNAIMIAPFKGIATSLINELIAQFKTDVLAKLPEWRTIGKDIADGILAGLRSILSSTPLGSLIPRPTPDFIITPEGIRNTAPSLPAKATGGLLPPTYDINDPSVRGYQHGGAFRVGGIGGRDSQMVRFRASPDETVHVMTPQQRARVYGGGGGGASIVNHNHFGPFHIAKEVDADRVVERIARLFEGAQSAVNAPVQRVQPGAL